jgi:pyruvate kinase
LLLDDGKFNSRLNEPTGAKLRESRRRMPGAQGHQCARSSRQTHHAKDIEDLKFGAKLGVDMVALSFVRSADDMWQARQILTEIGAPNIPLIAKIERPEALDHLEEILKVSQGVMVARGDLGLEMPLERVPTSQKEITRKARRSGIPVIVATGAQSMRLDRGPRALK